MKKIIALLLALIMVMGLATVVSADEPTFDASFVKEYVINSGTAPAETFNFTYEFVSYTDREDTTVTTAPAGAPTLTVGTADFEAISATATDTVEVTVNGVNNDTPLGVYVYEITEVASNTAGADYTATPIYLVATVTHTGDNNRDKTAVVHYTNDLDDLNNKVGKTTNAYAAGTLEITKTITGNMADLTDTFEFTVVFTPETSAYKQEDGAYVKTAFNLNTQIQTTADVKFVTNNDGTVTATFTMGHDDTVTFTNIPDGTAYVVSEDEKTYIESSTGETGTIAGGQKSDADFTNTKESEVDTGIAMDSVPFIVMAVVAVIGLAAFTAKKRVQE